MLLATGLVAIVAVALAGVGAAALYRRSKKIPDKVEVFGPFEVVTHTYRFMTGWNEGRLGTGTGENYSLRHRGKPFAFEGKAGMWGDQTFRYEVFNSAVTFPSPEPAVLLNVGDPNNTNFYYLVREEGGKAAAQYLGQSSGGVSAEWLDPPPGAVPEEKDVGLHRGRLEGGRWLLLGEHTVLDTRTLRGHALVPAKGFSVNQFKPAIAMSPDGGNFVRFGYSMESSSAPMLAVYEIESGASYTLPVDPARMRYNDWPEIDAAWLDHHFEWRKAEGGRLRLAERAGFTPLPYRGSLKLDPLDGYREYNLQPVRPEMRDRVIAFLEREYGAKLQPRGQYETSDTFLVGERKIYVMQNGGALGVWMDRGTDTRLVEDFAKRFDAVLATGELDGLFETPAPDG